MNQNPNFFGILPATVRFDDSISSSAKVFYTDISRLTNLKGYCFASNSYLSELTRSDERSIKRWLKELSDAGHILIVTEREGFRWNRKIYLKMNLPSSENVPIEVPEISSSKDKSGLRIIEDNSISKKKNYPPPPSRSRKSTRPPKSSAPPPPLVVPLSLEKLEAVSERVKKRIAKNHSVSDIDQAVEAVLAYSQENEVDNWDSLLSKAVKEKWKQRPSDSEEERRAKLEKIRATYNASIDPIEVGGYIVEVWGDEVLFRYPSNDSSKSVSFNVNDKNFIRKVNEFYNKHRRMDNRDTGTAKDSEETEIITDLKRRDSSL